ncbi:MAG: response regulator transcription factor [Saprospiraceae bacterium]|jgi:two-component system, OmpR family, alkaline phosphatase synthesis response regulator PhoP|nr:response regulator transcription factor [Saprospiraceae bacterium]MDP4821828.1 response regulator transcription factor [Saprospiraceae bacterium]MDP4997410.1 response regulator transcription factor [Saprospiraceae bacterium]
MRILLVEDEEYLRGLIRLNLEMEAYEVVTASNGKDAVKLFHEQHFDLVVLDVMLPEMNGFQVCEQIRLSNVKTPIIFLTAKDSSEDIIQGLKKGGDDYLTKPFVLEEFLLRIKNLLKRTSREQEMNLSIYQFGNNTVNFATYEATGDNGHFQLTKKEALLLKLLIDKKNQVVSRNEILQAVWGYDVYPSTRTIDNFILSFRKYFEQDPKNPVYFLSVRGVGYKFTEPEA